MVTVVQSGGRTAAAGDAPDVLVLLAELREWRGAVGQ